MKRTALVRRTPLRTKAIPRPRPRPRPRPQVREEGDKVTPGLHQLILARDGRCMAPVLDRDLRTLCRDKWGGDLPHGAYASVEKLELDHVPEANQTAMGDRAKSDPAHLVAICPYHHRGGWATSKRGRDFERAYLISLYG